MRPFKALTGVLAAAVAVLGMAFTASAETEDVEMSVVRAVQTNGAWGQSITYGQSDLNAANFTEDTQIRVEYELEGDAALPNQYQVELILQNYEVDPPIWAQVVPIEYDDTYAVFDYAGMVLAYGSDDLSGVNNICVGDRGIKMKVTKFTATNVNIPEVTTTEAVTEEEIVEDDTADNQPAETEAPAETASTAAETSSSGGSSVTVIIVVIVAAVVVAGVVVTVIVVTRNKKRFY
jgi:hypothetical protein